MSDIEAEALRAEVRQWQSAARDTAHTCTVTLERLAEMDRVVRAAQAWRADQHNEHEGTPTVESLVEQIDAYTERRRKAS